MSATTSRPGGLHPHIPPWRRPLARRSGEVQFGTVPGGPIIVGISEAEAAALTVLDGSVSIEASYRLASRAGVPGRRWRALIDLLDGVGVLVRPTRAEAGLARILLDGRGPFVAELQALLRRSGIEVTAAPDGPAATIADGPSDAPGSALAIVVDPLAVDPHRGDRWLRCGAAVLPVVADGPRATVGPLVQRGAGPCLWCLDLHRADRDRAWPVLITRRVDDAAGIVAPAAAASRVDPALSQLVAGCVSRYVEGVRTGEGPPEGVSLDLSVPWPRMDHRRWTVHPHCGRHDTARVR